MTCPWAVARTGRAGEIHRWAAGAGGGRVVLQAGSSAGVFLTSANIRRIPPSLRLRSRFLDGPSFARSNYLRFHVGEGLPLFRGPSNHVLSRQHVAQQVALAAYRA